jgi:hypothetical protein
MAEIQAVYRTLVYVLTEWGLVVANMEVSGIERA